MVRPLKPDLDAIALTSVRVSAKTRRLQDLKKNHGFATTDQVIRYYLPSNAAENRPVFHSSKEIYDLTKQRPAINTLYSLNGDVHRDGVTGLKNFTIIASDASFYNSIKSNIIMNNCTSENKMVHNGAIEKFTIMDPDGIQIIIKTK
jgi:hypothetical protein